MKDKTQSGRPLLEMLVVISIGFLLTAFGLLAGRKIVYHYKASAMLDYINMVYMTVRGRSIHDPKFGMEVSSPPLYSCSGIVPNMPGFIYNCNVRRICGCGSNTEISNKCSSLAANSELGVEAANSPTSCVTTVTATFKKGEEGAAATLESKLGLEVRDGLAYNKRKFIKGNCASDFPVECHNGFARCVSRGSHCSDMPRQ
ncbi:MAG: hypothetical protein J6P93_05020 [Alphaproteobacteria bacterium]|nr:hypothetical protein [Alphaproteobacteria bacterium]